MSKVSKKNVNTKAKKEVVIKNIPVLPLLDLVAFPAVSHSLLLVKKKSISVVSSAIKNNSSIFLVAQKNLEALEDIKKNDLYSIGVIAKILRVMDEGENGIRVHVEGESKAKLLTFTNKENFYKGNVQIVSTKDDCKAYSEKIGKLMQQILGFLSLEVSYQILSEEFVQMVEAVEDPMQFANLLSAYYTFDTKEAQSLLEENDVYKKLVRIKDKINSDLERILLLEDIKNKTVENMSEDQRKYYLREQIKTIRKDLGEDIDEDIELEELILKSEALALPLEVKKEVDWQLGRLKRLQPEMSEYAVIRTYLEWVFDLPWNEKTKDNFNLRKAKRILNEDHYGLDEIKQRLLEFLSVKKLKQDAKGPLLCLVGPPGVGKTSLGKSIARALDRKFFRIALGGVRDEAEIRGHRKTYVGALPGRIIQGLKQVKSKNPVFLLDEIDKLGADFRGDPSAALLEVLDPAQNKEFRDHYIDLDFDLSEVLFIATANSLATVPAPLLDRLEVIEISGYTSEEKLAIAKKYIVPRQMKANAISNLNITFDDNALLLIIDKYTRESGVRELERTIAAICRKVAYEYNMSGKVKKKITRPVVKNYLGPIRYDIEIVEKHDAVGLANGMAWTVVGGELLPIEVSIAHGTGHLNLTGQLGSVMQESAQTAFFYTRANAKKYGIDEEFYKNVDVHIHAPNGAVPKDGPSAGVTICTALISALINKKVPHKIAMTGEITLRGNVLPVGGIKEKVLGAIRHGVNTIFVPKENLADIPKVKEKVKFIGVEHVSEILSEALSLK
ncbi:MAG: endopeptidase La [Bdellovibrionota bacterium]